MRDVKDRLKANPALYRAELSCRIGKDLIEGKAKPPAGVTREEWLWFMLFSAIEDLAKGVYAARQEE
jgi:hypothetical protein